MSKIFLDAGSVGRVVSYDGRIWRVGLVNTTRARLDPLTGRVVMADPTSGRTFSSFGDSVNVSPTSYVDEVNVEDLDENALGRYIRMEEAAMNAEEENGSRKSHKSEPVVADAFRFTSDEEEGVTDEGTPIVPVEAELEGKVASAAVTPSKSLRDRNKQRLAVLKAKKAQRAASGGGVKASGKPARVKKEPGPCHCGCGQKTGGYFVPGHDARFKGWLLKIERGEETKEKLLKKSVIDSYKWVRSGIKGEDGTPGERPTTNYKGEQHKGYA